ncbi:carbohydrate porin [Aliidiomarina taiwanensis]|uniref:carbohydrate porin n=1 Tax=Aliidiomarina taiwanensis TaxID=946228 RepID=UPI0018E4F61F|nr:carbohydrate porin [Aliidiomarina taiwanensis]
MRASVLLLLFTTSLFSYFISPKAFAEEDGITVGGAVRFQYVLADYDTGQKNRGGDLDFDIFRLDLDGRKGDVILSAQYRWFNYMQALRHAYMGYDFTDEWQGQIGIVIQPFGTMPYNSHSYFFSSNFYLGLEDNNGAGIKFTKRSSDWDLDIAYILNDELGGATGAARSKADRYNYDVTGIRLPGEGIYDEPTQAVGENNTFMLRAAHKWNLGAERQFELGASVHYGGFHDGVASVGTRQNFAVHMVYDHGPWQFQGQYATYDYNMDIENNGVVVGAYAYFDTIPESADIYTANVAYSKDVSLGPITNLNFYNNYSLITNKSGLQDDTMMNVTGVAVSAGGMFTYIDYVIGQNQPFINGSIGQDGGSTEHRFNINFGFYF